MQDEGVTKCVLRAHLSTKAASVRVGTAPSPGGTSLGEFAAQDCSGAAGHQQSWAAGANTSRVQRHAGGKRCRKQGRKPECLLVFQGQAAQQSGEAQPRQLDTSSHSLPGL